MTHNGDYSGLTEAEKARYDRQIRVWGADAQERIQGSRVLFCGLSGLNAEAIKNAVLAGISICLQDSRKVCMDDLSSAGYFLQVEDVGKDIVDAALPRIQELNTFAQVTSERRDIEDLEDSFFCGFKVISVADSSDANVNRVSQLCHKDSDNHIVMFASWAFGQEGVFMSDFGPAFQFKEDERPNYIPQLKVISFPSIGHTLTLPWASLQKGKFLPLSSVFVKSQILARSIRSNSNMPLDLFHLSSHSLAQGLLTQTDMEGLSRLHHLSDGHPICSVTVASVLGAFLAQEIVKGVSKVGEPAYNTHIYTSGAVQVYPLNETMTAPMLESKKPEESFVIDL